MGYFVPIVAAGILLTGCATSSSDPLVSGIEAQLRAQCIQDNAPRSYLESQFVDPMATLTSCGDWARDQVSGPR
jgi:hypothetical protein